MPPRLLALFTVSLLTLAALPACTETRVIKDNTLDAKFGRSMNPNGIMRAGDVGKIQSR